MKNDNFLNKIKDLWRPQGHLQGLKQGCHNQLDLKFKDISRTFKDLFEQIQGPSELKRLYYSAYQFSNEVYKICFWEKFVPPFLFSFIVTSKVSCPVVTNSSSSSYFAVEGQKFAHSRIFKDRNPNSRTFQGLEFSFANSRTFQDFEGPWQPCLKIQIQKQVFCRLYLTYLQLQHNTRKS